MNDMDEDYRWAYEAIWDSYVDKDSSIEIEPKRILEPGTTMNRTSELVYAPDEVWNALVEALLKEFPHNNWECSDLGDDDE